MKFSVFTASTPEWTREEAVKILAEQGWHGIEWRIVDQSPPADAQAGFWSGNKATWPLTGLEDHLDEIKAITADAGLGFSSIGAYVPPTEREDAERVLAATAALGAPQVRIGGLRVGPGESYREVFAACREHWEWVEDRARHHGVRALIELHHKTLTPSASAARRLLEGFDPKYVGAIHDVGNMVIEGWEEPVHSLDLLGEYLAHVHVKNSVMQQTGVDADGTARWESKWVPLREGQAHLPTLFEALKTVGYDGWVAVEDFSTVEPLRERTAGNLAYLTAIAQAAGHQVG